MFLFKIWSFFKSNYEHEIYSLKSSKSIDLDKAAAIENDETMIINSDHSIITTPIESPLTDLAGTSKRVVKSPDKKVAMTPIESDETPTSESSTSDAVAKAKNKRHRPKARSDSNRSEKYAKKLFFVFLLIGCSESVQHLLNLLRLNRLDL